MKIASKLFFISTLILALSFSCKKKKKDEESEQSFEKTTLMTNIGTNIILPDYENLLTSLVNFETKYDAFIADKTDEKLTEVKDAWKNAYLQWNKVTVYEFGPAMDLGLRAALGTFPTDTTKVLNNIANGGYTLGALSNIDAVGFSVFDFLFYRNNALSHFQNNGSQYGTYGKDVLTKMKNEVSSVVSTWNSTYLSTFKTSTGTESSSSFSLFVNEYNKSYEITKWTKIGIPIGKQSLGIARPEYIEARQSTYGISLLLENMKSMKRLFNGDKENGTTGVGFDDYLIALNKSDLSSSINSQFNSIISDIESITSTFEQTMNSNPSKLDALYTKVHSLTIDLKTEMSAAFGVLITYQDNDGD